MKNTIKTLATTLSLLAVTSASTLAADGYGGSATGGAGGTSVTVTTAADLIKYATSSSKYIITVSGTITVTGGTGTSGGSVRVASNKTIQGANTSAKIIGTLDLGSGGVNNVIIQKLNLTNPNGIGTGDGITCWGAKNVFVTKCNFYDCSDGCCDINNFADNVTVSWCHFYYPSQSSHRFTMIIGEAGVDNKALHVTLHHNWWGSRCDQRMPASTWGYAHMYNNYFNCTGNSYCSDARASAQFRSENNYYSQVNNPLYKESGGLIYSSGNTFNACTGTAGYTGKDSVFTPPYSYSLTATASVPSTVQNGAGNK